MGLSLTAIAANQRVIVPANPLQPFTFADNFDSGPTNLYQRDGWQLSTVDGRTQQMYTVSNQHLKGNDGFGINATPGIDTGRLEGYVEAKWVSNAFSAGGFLNVNAGPHTQWEGIRLGISAAGRVQLYCYRSTDNVGQLLFDTQAGAGAQLNDVIRLTYAWNTARTSMTVSVTANGVTPAWNNINTGSFTVSSSILRPSSFVGVGAASNNTEAWDNFVASAPTGAAKPRLALSQLPGRLYQAKAGTNDKQITLGGKCQQITDIQFRLLQNGSVVSGWDWGQKAFVSKSVSSSSWSVTLPAIPRGIGYVVELADTVDPLAFTRTPVFAIDTLVIHSGQSNDTPAVIGNWGASGVANTYLLNGQSEDPNGLCRLNKNTLWTGPVASASNSMGASYIAKLGSLVTAGRAVGLLPLGRGSTSLAAHLPGATVPLYNTGESLWDVLVRQVQFAGGDIAAMTWGQGEEDAGRSLTANAFDATKEAQYRANLQTLANAVASLVGRTLGVNFFFGILGLGRYASGTPGAAAASDPSYDRFRRMQWDICEGPGAVAGFFWCGTKLDLTMSTNDPDHMDAVGNGNEGLRCAAAVAKKLGYQTTDYSGIRFLSAAASGNDIILQYQPNGETSLTVPSVPDNLIFATDSGFTNLLTASAGTAVDATHIKFTLSGPAAGVYVKSPNGAHPKTLNGTFNTVKSVYADGQPVISCPIFNPLQAS